MSGNDYKIERYFSVNHLCWMYAILRPEQQPDGTIKYTVQRDAAGFYEDNFVDFEAAEQFAGKQAKV